VAQRRRIPETARVSRETRRNGGETFLQRRLDVPAADLDVVPNDVRSTLTNRSHRARTSGLKSADIVAKVFLGDGRQFLEPLMSFTRGDVREPCRFIQNRSRVSVKINFREIFWVVRFSTFATISAINRREKATGRESRIPTRRGASDPRAVS
jgi:hypothetical protein